MGMEVFIPRGNAGSCRGRLLSFVRTLQLLERLHHFLSPTAIRGWLVLHELPELGGAFISVSATVTGVHSASVWSGLAFSEAKGGRISSRAVTAASPPR